ncbi:MAG: ABC transporter transmembrane domain-containing protein, partial [Propionicimonas sp.]|nr:ABC transporter transmembrane domain-containing protein [Propionicimonas sp.]
MTITAEQPTTDAPPGPSGGDAAEARAQQQADARALKELMRPVARSLLVGRILAVVSGVLAVVPYIALVQIGAVLLAAARDQRPVDADAVNQWLMILLTAFTLRLLVYFGALLITHLADIRLGHLIRLRMVRRFSRVPLVWFTATNSGRVRKALQDDIGTIHNLIAHQPVEGTNAVVMPVALMVYAFVIDWRLGLLSVTTLPFYVAAMSVSMRGMGEKTVQMDSKLAVVSARMVEFVTGITVVKA